MRIESWAVLEVEELPGAEVRVFTSPPLSAIRDLESAPDLASQWAVFVREARPEWGIEDADGPVPVSEDALQRLPAWLPRVLMRGWRDASAQPPAPLRLRSSGTTP